MIGAIDQSTTSTKFHVFDLQGHVIIQEQKEYQQFTPQSGWIEHNPLEILQNVNYVLQQGATAMIDKNEDQKFLIIAQSFRHTNNRFNQPERNNCCLEQNEWVPINTYFSAFKMRWMLDNCAALKQDIIDKPNEVLFGTIDTWVLWNFNGSKHLTDVTNASRTFLMNLTTLQWDQEMLRDFNIVETCLATILPSGSDFGQIKSGPFMGCTINAILGDQMAAAIGHGLFNEGQIKNTYGTGLFLLTNIGEKLRIVDEGLLTSVLYQKDKQSKPTYAFEGAIECGGSTINWARDKLNLFSNYQELNDLVEQTHDTQGIYFVLAFSGLYTPYLNKDAAGMIVGLSLNSDKQHILKAIYESLCYRTKDVINTMEQSGQIKISSLNVDGGLTKSNILMQMQADILQKNLVKPLITDSTCLGVALYAAYGSIIQLKLLILEGVIKSEKDILAILVLHYYYLLLQVKFLQLYLQGTLLSFRSMVLKMIHLIIEVDIFSFRYQMNESLQQQQQNQIRLQPSS